MADYEIWLRSATGAKLDLLEDAVRFHYVLSKNGRCQVVLPGLSYNYGDFERDYRLEFYRDGVLDGDAVYFIRKKQMQLLNGEWTIELFGIHATRRLLQSRVIAYHAGSTEASATNEPADDLIKRLVLENLGSDAVTNSDRDENPGSVAAILEIEADLSAAPNITKRFSRDNLLDIVDDIAEDSRRQGTPLFYGFRKQSNGLLQFQTRTDQWGSDRTGLMTLSPEFGTLIEGTLEDNWEEEVTVAYALGGDQGADRVVRSKINTTLTGSHPLYWIEETTDMRDTTDTAPLDSEAQSLLGERRAIRQFTGLVLQDTESLRYGRDWFWGDRMSAEFNGETFEVWANAVSVSVARGGDEDISGAIEIVA